MAAKPRVLIVDDSIMMRRMISDIVVRNGFEVIGQAGDGIRAFEMYKELRPDIVTMDIVMPKENGMESLKKIMEMDPNACIIIISGLHYNALMLEALQAGAVDFVVKPFTEEDLIGSLRKVFRGDGSS